MTPPTINEPGTADLVSVRTVELIVGRRLEYPLYDNNGVLLLAEGNEITSTFKRLLFQRGVRHVHVHADDRDRATLGRAPEDDEDRGFAPELTAPLDELVESGALFVSNSGPPLHDDAVFHGCKAYDEEQRRALVEAQRAHGQLLDGMMLEAMRGKRLQGAMVGRVVASYITHLTADADCVVSVAAAATSNPDISEHCLRMSILGMAIGVEMGLDESNVRDLGLCGLVHDWGMIRVPRKLRDASRLLTPAEFLEVKKHPIHSLELLQTVAGLPNVVPLVCYQVHEQPNGRGYPRGRRGNAIHLFARILKVADVYAGMTSRRAFRPPFSAYSAMECLVRLSRDQSVDAKVARAFLNMTCLFPVGSHVVLSDGSAARVLRRNGDEYTRPIVQVVQNADGTEVDEQTIVDLRDSELSVQQSLPTPGSDEQLLDPERIEIER